MHKVLQIVLEILSLIKSFIALKIRKIEREIKIQEKREESELTINEKISLNNENIKKGKVDEIALKMKEFNDTLNKTKEKDSESKGKKKK